MAGERTGCTSKSMVVPFLHALTPSRMPLDSALELTLRLTFDSGAGGLHCSSSSLGEVVQWAQTLGIIDALLLRLIEFRVGDEPTMRRALDVDGISASANMRRRDRDACLVQVTRGLCSVGVDLVLLHAPVLVRHSHKRHAQITSELHALVEASEVTRIAVALDAAGVTCMPPSSGADAQRVFRGVGGTTLLLRPMLRFVRIVPGGNFVDPACLKRCGLLVPVAVENGFGVWRPSDAVRVAQIVAQALVEYRFVPEYSLFGALRAVAELGLADNHDLAFDAYTLLQTDVRYAEFDAFRELLRGLVHGELTGLSSPARVLLDHALASARQPLYRVKLSAQRRLQQWQQDGLLERFVDTCEGVAARIRRMR